MDDRLTLQLRNSLDDIPAANDTATAWLDHHEVALGAAYLANLAIEELATNCIKYGYSDDDVHLITVEMERLDKELVITVIDDGNPFDPLAQTAPDTTLPVEDRPIGGLGLHLLRQMSDDFAYARIDGNNRVTLRKRLT
jgi:anti-sigma regulatory factor (Ser/Thr protein kinase)